jgi:hypothetical protein
MATVHWYTPPATAPDETGRAAGLVEEAAGRPAGGRLAANCLRFLLRAPVCAGLYTFCRALRRGLSAPARPESSRGGAGRGWPDQPDAPAGTPAADPALLRALARRGAACCVSPAGWWVELRGAGPRPATIIALWPGRYELYVAGGAPAVYPTAEAVVAAALEPRPSRPSRRVTEGSGGDRR